MQESVRVTHVRRLTRYGSHTARKEPSKELETTAWIASRVKYKIVKEEEERKKNTLTKTKQLSLQRPPVASICDGEKGSSSAIIYNRPDELCKDSLHQKKINKFMKHTHKYNHLKE